VNRRTQRWPLKLNIKLFTSTSPRSRPLCGLNESLLQAKAMNAHLMPLEDTGAARRLDQLIGFETGMSSKTVAGTPGRQRRKVQVLEKMVARDGIEPPTQGFSVLGGCLSVSSRIF